MYDKRNVIEYIISALCGIGLLIYSIIAKKYKLLIITLVLVFLFIVICIAVYISNKKYNKALSRYYHKLKDKKDKSIYEELYMLSYQDKLDELIKQKIKTEKIKGISDITAHYDWTKSVEIGLSFNGFSFNCSLDNNSAVYSIKTSARYQMLDNKQFEKERKANYLIESCNSVEDFIENLCELIAIVVKEINDYCDINIVDEVFNGRLYDKVKPYISDYKNDIIACGMLSLLIAALGTMGILRLIEVYKEDNIELLIMLYAMISLSYLTCVLSFFYFLYAIVKHSQIKKDLKLKEVDYLIDKPLKAHIRSKITENRTSSSIKDMRYMTLVFKNIKLYVLLPGPYGKRNSKELCEECRKIETKLTYLPKSHVVVMGEENYLNLAKKHLNQIK